MKPEEARALIAPAVPGTAAGRWADLGAGEGTFTRALAALLGPAGRVYAVDRDPGAVATLRGWAAASRAAGRAGGLAEVVVLQGDFTRPLADTRLTLDGPLDGLLLANALHFVPDAGAALARLAAELLAPEGRVAIVEYDRRPASRWVPYPLDASRLPEIAARAGLGAPRIIGTRPSAFGGEMYAAVMEKG